MFIHYIHSFVLFAKFFSKTCMHMNFHFNDVDQLDMYILQKIHNIKHIIHIKFIIGSVAFSTCIINPTHAYLILGTIALV